MSSVPDRCFSDFVFNILSQVFGCSNKNPLKKLLYPINSRVFDGVKEKIKKYNKLTTKYQRKIAKGSTDET